MNVDAALFASSQCMGAEAVNRDHRGTFVAAAGNSFPQVVSTELAEATAIRFGLSWANEEGLAISSLRLTASPSSNVLIRPREIDTSKTYLLSRTLLLLFLL
jgi:hypothetical protein